MHQRSTAHRRSLVDVYTRADKKRLERGSRSQSSLTEKTRRGRLRTVTERVASSALNTAEPYASYLGDEEDRVRLQRGGSGGADTMALSELESHAAVRRGEGLQERGSGKKSY